MSVKLAALVTMASLPIGIVSKVGVNSVLQVWSGTAHIRAESDTRCVAGWWVVGWVYCFLLNTASCDW